MFIFIQIHSGVIQTFPINVVLKLDSNHFCLSAFSYKSGSTNNHSKILPQPEHLPKSMNKVKVKYLQS